MKQYCLGLGLGIEHQPTASYSPQSSGITERMNRTLLDMVQPMIFNSNLSLSVWGEAVNTACYLKNCKSTRAFGMTGKPHRNYGTARSQIFVSLGVRRISIFQKNCAMNWLNDRLKGG